MPFFLVRQAPGASAPPAASIGDTDALAYFQASQTASVTTSGESLAAAASQMASGPDFETTSGSAPDYLAGQVNGLHAALFDGSSEHLRLTPSTGQDQWLIGGGGFAGVFELASLGQSAYPRAIALADKRYVNFFAGSDPTTFKLEFYCRYTDGDGRWQSAHDVGTFGQPFILELYHDAGSTGAAPVIRVNGATIQLVQLSVGSGAVSQAPSGEVIYFGNRRADESGSFTLNRGVDGKIAGLVPFLSVPTLADQKTVLGELAAEWGLAIADPFLPTVEAQSFSVNEGALVGTSVGTVQAQNEPTMFTLSGDAALYFAMDGPTLKVNAVLPAAGADIAGTITVANSFGSDSAAISISTIATSADALKYPAPNISTWISRKLGPTGTYSESFSATDKVVVYGADSIRTATKTWVDGAGSVAYIGGHYKPTSKTNDRAIYAKNIHDEIYVEGVVLEPPYAQDAFQFSGASGKKPLVTFQLVWAGGLDAIQSSKHADWAQPLGPVGTIRLYECYGECGYQGLFFDDDNGSGAKVDRVELEDVDLEHLRVDPNVGHRHSYLIWLDTTYANGALIGPGVYVTEKTGQTAQSSSVWPKAPAAVRSGNLISWPGTNISGSVIVGKRPGGPKLDRATIGIVGGQAYLNVRGYLS